MAKGKSGNGSNFSLPNPKQSQHVKQKKDSMAGNVGGNAHMLPSKAALGLPGGKVAKSGAKGK